MTVDNALVPVRFKPVSSLLIKEIFFLALSILLNFSFGFDLAETVVAFFTFGDFGVLDFSVVFWLSCFFVGELDLVLVLRLILVGIRERELRR